MKFIARTKTIKRSVSKFIVKMCSRVIVVDLGVHKICRGFEIRGANLKQTCVFYVTLFYMRKLREACVI